MWKVLPRVHTLSFSKLLFLRLGGCGLAGVLGDGSVVGHVGTLGLKLTLAEQAWGFLHILDLRCRSPCWHGVLVDLAW